MIKPNVVVVLSKQFNRCGRNFATHRIAKNTWMA